MPTREQVRRLLDSGLDYDAAGRRLGIPPGRFLPMLRVFKATSPMSVGTWLLSAYVPAAGVASLTALTGRLRWTSHAATAGAALLAPVVAAYTAALISDTAVPAWHDRYPEMPFVFTGSADPRDTVVPQRKRRDEREAARPSA